MKKLLIAFLLLPFLASATHNMAGSLSFTNISGYTYMITVVTFTNTAGTTADRCELMVYFGNGDSALAPRINGPAGPLCPATHDGTMIAICSSVEKYNIYQTQTTFSGPGTYLISVNDPNRTSGIMNIVNSATTLFHLEAELVINPFFSGNSSPSFLNNPIICSPVNSPYSYNAGAFDPDGDSLYYENTLRGTSGYTDPTSSNMFFIDSLTGDVIWDLPNTIGNYVYDIRITEWKNVGGTYYYAGSSMQEVWTYIVSGTSGTENQGVNSNISVYPNPSFDNVNFKISNPIFSEQYYIVIYNSLGQTIKNISANNNLLSVTGLSPGMYFYSLNTVNEILKQGKFIILEGSLK